MKTSSLVTMSFALLLAGRVEAQTTLSGTVMDETAHGLPGTNITLAGPSVHASTISGANGEYQFLGLTSGTYQLTLNLSGFSPVTRSGIVIDVSDVELLRRRRLIARKEVEK